MSQDYWTQFWLEYTKSLEGKDLQSQVLRVRNKVAISEDLWKHTVSTILKDMPPDKSDTVLDLCCGNGLLTDVYAPLVSKVTAVDLSPQLIDEIAQRGYSNVEGISSDIRTVHFDDEQFTKVIWYAGIQYLSEADIVKQLKKIRRWLKQGGMLFIGDIPDRSKMWGYFNSLERQQAYFDSIENHRPIIGTWLDYKWMENVTLACNFTTATAVAQDEKLIYADFRYDLKAQV